jgi:hypothetical protein
MTAPRTFSFPGEATIVAAARALLPAVVALAALLVGACAREIGRDFDPDQADKLLVGVSTLDDARKVLGEPLRVFNHGRSSTAKWWYLRDTPAGTEAVLLEIRFGDDGRKTGIVREFEKRIAPESARHRRSPIIAG